MKFFNNKTSLDIIAPKLDLDILNLFSNDIQQAEGNLEMKFSLRGTPNKPYGDGYLGVHQGKMFVSALGKTLDDITIDLRLTRSNHLKLENLYIHSGKGTLQGSGTARFTDKFEEARLHLKAANFDAIEDDLLEIILDGNLDITANKDIDFNIDGDMKILEGELRIPETTTSVVVEDTISTIINEWVNEHLESEINLEIKRNTWIRNRELNIEIKGELVLIKDLKETEFKLFGTVEAIKGGTYKLYGKKFIVDEGKISFSGPILNPELNIIASYNLPDITIYVIINGELEQFELSLSSTPEMEEKDILSYLFFGKPYNFLTTDEQNTIDNDEQAMQLLTGYAAAQLTHLVGEELGLDVLELETDFQTGGTKIAIGKYIIRNLFVKYTQEFGETTNESLKAEYRFGRGFSMEASTSTEGESGADLYWLIEW